MAYSDFVQSDGYNTKETGAAYSLVLIDVQNPSVPILEAMGGINWADNFPDSPVEEAGNDRVEEFVKERHSGSGNCSFFHTPKRNDKMPTVETFLGRDFVIVQSVAPKREGAGNVINYFQGVSVTGYNSSHGARGLVNGSFSFNYIERKNGQEHADSYGSS
jgi:hypothetical protein